MNELTTFYRFGTALAIGMLIGLQREHSHGRGHEEVLAGVRTFALMSLIGCTAALAAEKAGSPVVFITVLLLVGILIAIGYFVTAKQGDIGLTTEMASIVTVMCGALCYWEYWLLAAAIGVITTILLSLKLEMHAFAQKLTREDIYATLKFAVIAVIILPVLPNASYGPPPFDALNPFKIWLMVILISAISFLGYVLFKLIGARYGLVLTGLLGGLVSSTAVTMSYTQQAKALPSNVRGFAQGIVLAWTVMFLRVLVVVFLFSPTLGEALWLPISAAAVVGLAFASLLFFKGRSDEKGETVSFSNPFELGPAIKFGLLYGFILLIVRAAQLYLGNMGTYVAGLLSGIADVDAITLTMIELSGKGDFPFSPAARTIVLAVTANTLAKSAIVMAGGPRELRITILPLASFVSVGLVLLAFLM